MISQKYLKECISYCAETGEFRWLERPRYHFKKDNAWKTFNLRRKGTNAGCMNADGYWVIGIDRKHYVAARLAYLYETGTIPHTIVYRDGDKTNLKFLNLENSSREARKRSKRLAINNMSGVTGVSWHKRNERWCAYIAINKKRKTLGYYRDINDAINARKRAEAKHYIKGFKND